MNMNHMSPCFFYCHSFSMVINQAMDYLTEYWTGTRVTTFPYFGHGTFEETFPYSGPQFPICALRSTDEQQYISADGKWGDRRNACNNQS